MATQLAVPLLVVGVVATQLDREVGRPRGEHPPHAADLVPVQLAEGRVVETGVGRVAGAHRLAVGAVERVVETLDEGAVGLGGHMPTLTAQKRLC